MAKLIGMKERMKLGDFWFFCILGIALVCVYYFGQTPELNHREIIIFVSTTIVLFVLLGLKIWSNIENHNFAFVFLIAVGVLSMMIQPILNIPDETVHFARAEWVSRGNVIADFDKQEYETIQSVLDLEANVKKSYDASSIKDQKINNTTKKIDYIAEGNIVFLYLPQAIGVLIAKILQLDVIWMLWLARLGNLLCYALGIGLAVKMAPKWKFPIFFVSALPMSIQQAASCSPDAMINASALLLIAYFLLLYCSNEKKITRKELLVFGVLALIVTIFKVTNIFIAGLILLVPLDNFHSKGKGILSKCMVVLGAVLVGGVYYWYTTLFPSNPSHVAYFETANVNSAEQIQYILTNFGKWFREFGVASLGNFESYMGMLGSFGWVEYGSYLIPIITTFMFAKICFQESGVCLSRVNKFLIFLMVIGIYCASCVAMYISWTPVGSNGILGVQGRYFIPMIALMTLLFSSSHGVQDSQQKHIGDVITMLGMNGAMLIATATRYY